MKRDIFGRTYSQSGQALVLVLLSLSVVLTIVLFILSRSVTDITTSTVQSDSVRAFSAAEAGVERALVAGGTFTGSIGGASYTVSASSATGGTFFNYPITLMSGENSTLWFVSHDSNGNIVCSAGSPCFTGNLLKVCWGNPGTSSSVSTTPALEVSIYFENTPGDLSTIRIGRKIYDPNSTRILSNAFTAPDSGNCQINGMNYSFQKLITLSDLGIPVGSSSIQNGLIFAKMRMIYNTDAGHLIGADANLAGDTLLPSQGINIVSTGVSGVGGDASNRRVNVFKGWAEFPFAGVAIFYPSGIVK